MFFFLLIPPLIAVYDDKVVQSYIFYDLLPRPLDTLKHFKLLFMIITMFFSYEMGYPNLRVEFV